VILSQQLSREDVHFDYWTKAEFQAQCQKLGLNTKGSRDALQERLEEHLGQAA
jgi:hypothetical protein